MILDSNNQQWIKWNPSKFNLAGNYHTGQIIDQPNSLKIIITKIDQSKTVEFLFNKSVWAYRRTSESFRQNIFKDLALDQGRDFYVDWSFFTIQPSVYLEWLGLESCHLANKFDLVHYVIMTLDDVIEVAANYEPQVKIYENESHSNVQLKA